MKKFTVALMTATAFIATPAMADDGEFYLGMGSGIGEAENVQLTEQAFNSPVEISTELGWEAEALLGYDAGPVRFELEGAYRNFDVDMIDAGTVGVPFATPTSYALDFGPQDPVNGEMDGWSAMFNALLDFGG
ncbi:MAG: hypothetical protein KDE15_05405, partial [Erythrobacter sp.]|nr:hypothetical protein [Erythrobacter sp.]